MSSTTCRSNVFAGVGIEFSAPASSPPPPPPPVMRAPAPNPRNKQEELASSVFGGSGGCRIVSTTPRYNTNDTRRVKPKSPDTRESSHQRSTLGTGRHSGSVTNLKTIPRGRSSRDQVSSISLKDTPSPRPSTSEGWCSGRPDPRSPAAVVDNAGEWKTTAGGAGRYVRRRDDPIPGDSHSQLGSCIFGEEPVSPGSSPNRSASAQGIKTRPAPFDPDVQHAAHTRAPQSKAEQLHTTWVGPGASAGQGVSPVSAPEEYPASPPPASWNEQQKSQWDGPQVSAYSSPQKGTKGKKSSFMQPTASSQMKAKTKSHKQEIQAREDEIRQQVLSSWEATEYKAPPRQSMALWDKREAKSQGPGSASHSGAPVKRSSIAKETRQSPKQSMGDGPKRQSMALWSKPKEADPSKSTIALG